MEKHFIRGKYAAKFPNRKVRGFHFNSIASTLFGWEKIVKGFLEAKEALSHGNIELMKSWVNTELGQTWEEDGEAANKDELARRREKYGCEVPAEVMILTAGVDTQDDRFEIEVVGWGVGHESFGILYKRIYGDLKQPEVWERLDDFLSQKFTRADGVQMGIHTTCMDTQGHFFNKVTKYVKERTARRILVSEERAAQMYPIYQGRQRITGSRPIYLILALIPGKAFYYNACRSKRRGRAIVISQKMKGK